MHSPQALALTEPTGGVVFCARGLNQAISHARAGSLPLCQAVAVPARQAYSHCASVGSANVRPTLRESQSQNASASSYVTVMTGCSSLWSKPGVFQLKR